MRFGGRFTVAAALVLVAARGEFSVNDDGRWVDEVDEDVAGVATFSGLKESGAGVQRVEVSGFSWSGCIIEGIAACKDALKFGFDVSGDTLKALDGVAGLEEFTKFGSNVVKCEQANVAAKNRHCFMEYTTSITLGTTPCAHNKTVGYDMGTSAVTLNLDFVGVGSVYTSDPEPFKNGAVTVRALDFNGGDTAARCSRISDKPTRGAMALLGKTVTHNGRTYHSIWMENEKQFMEVSAQFSNTDKTKTTAPAFKADTTFLIQMKRNSPTFPPITTAAEITKYSAEQCDLTLSPACLEMEKYYKSGRVNKPSRIARLGDYARTCEKANLKVDNKNCEIHVEARIVMPMSTCGKDQYGFDVGEVLFDHGGFEIIQDDGIYVQIPAADIKKDVLKTVNVYSGKFESNATEPARCAALNKPDAVKPVALSLDAARSFSIVLKKEARTLYALKPADPKAAPIHAATQIASPSYKFAPNTLFAVRLARANMNRRPDDKPKPKKCRTRPPKPE